MVQVNSGLGAMYLDFEQVRDVLRSAQTILAGSSAAVAQYSREIKLPKTVNRLVPWDHSRKGISPGTLIQAFVVNILGDRKALYRVSEFYRDKDKVFSEVALLAIAAHNVPIKVVYSDATSMSVQGEYDGEEEDAIDVTYGFSKNKRPDLKQIVFGIGSNQQPALSWMCSTPSGCRRQV